MCLRAGGSLALAIGAPLAAPLHAQADPTAIINRVRVDTRRPIDFHAAAFPETVYVGQQTTHQTAVFLTENARNRLRRNPEFIPPEFRGLLSYELSAPRRVLPSRAPGYEAHVFQRALFPVAEGTLEVPAPELRYALPASSSYFSREERYAVRAESAHLVVRPLPAEGRPASFTGAVGVLKVTARIDTMKVRVGDPVVLTLRVQGIGNVKLFPRPVIEIDWASAVPGTERVQVDSTGLLVRGAKEFDWILTPARSGAVTLPPLEYDYFDPYKAQYASALTLPLALDVAEGSLAAAEPGESAALMPLRAGNETELMQRGLSLDDRASQLAVLLLLLLAPVPAFVMAMRRRRPRARVAAVRSGPAIGLDSLRAVMSDPSDPSARARSARRALHVALADRLGVSPQLLTSRRQVRRVLRRRGVTRAGTSCVIELLEDLDTLGFAPADAAGANESIIERAQQCFAIVDQEAVKGGGTGSAGSTMNGRNLPGALLLLVMLAAPHARVGAQDAAAAATAYSSRLFQDAEQQYASLVRNAPRDADLLVNWGTAAWAAGDTVTAVTAWQRAARIDPLAVDVQERLMLLPSGARGGVADVPMVPVAFLQTAAILLWIVGWFVAALLESRRHPDDPHGAPWSGVLGGIVWIALIGAIVAGGSALWGRRALDAHALAVIVRPETMHIAPGTDSDAMGGVATGDIVKRLESDGGWVQVLHSDGRQGWLPASRLTQLMSETVVDAANTVDLSAPMEHIDLSPLTRDSARR